MTLRLQLRRAAAHELDTAAAAYDHERTGLGAAFVAAVSECFDRIADGPSRYAVLRGDIRCAHLRRFPYRVFYRVRTESIVVIAILHASRDPLIWQGRR